MCDHRWTDVTKLGCMYEERYCFLCKRHEYRPLSLRHAKRQGINLEERGFGPWQLGETPLPYLGQRVGT